MSKKNFLYVYLLVLLLTIIFLFIDFKISLGIIVGHLFSLINYYLIILRYRDLSKVSAFTIISIIFSTLVLVIPIMLAFLLPDIISWIGVIIGLLVLKMSIIITNIKVGK